MREVQYVEVTSAFVFMFHSTTVVKLRPISMTQIAKIPNSFPNTHLDGYDPTQKTALGTYKQTLQFVLEKEHD